MNKIGLFGVGLDTYWIQFAGLYNRLVGYQADLKVKMEEMGANVIDAGLVDNPQKAIIAANLLKSEDVELVFLFVSTYALSSTVLPVAQRVKVPVIILNLQPVAAINYEAFNALGDRGKMTGEWLAHCQACSVPEIVNVFNRSGIQYEIVTGYLDDPYAWKEIKGWIDASYVSRTMRDNRLGILGHYYGGMLDVYTDLTQQCAIFGTHIELIEMCEVREYREKLTAEGESVPGPVLEIGNTNSRYRFSIGARKFINQWSKQGPAHHCAIGLGHIADKIQKLGLLFNIPVVKIC